MPFYVCLAPKAGSTSLTSILLDAAGFFDDGTKQPSNVSIGLLQCFAVPKFFFRKHIDMKADIIASQIIV